MKTIKEIALKVAQATNLHYIVTSEKHTNDGWNIRFAEALISAYKAELLKEVQGGQPDLGEPVAYMTTDEEGSASMLFFDRAEALKYSGDDEPVNLFAESQLQAAQKELNQCSGLLDDSLRSIEMLEDQLATAEQRVAEWQPIETAPKDGQSYLAYSTEFVNQYWVTDKCNGMTHWMPLPKAPANGGNS